MQVAWFRQRKASEQWYTDYGAPQKRKVRDRRLRRASDFKLVARSLVIREVQVGCSKGEPTPRKQERVLPQSRRRSKKNCPPSQPISSRTKKQRRDPHELHLARRRGVLNKENIERRRQPGMPRWFSSHEAPFLRDAVERHTAGALHCTVCTALQQSSPDRACQALRERNAFLASAACTNPPLQLMTVNDAQRKKEPHAPQRPHAVGRE
jgi:hypothetical protein